jgi:hypothetical protein
MLDLQNDLYFQLVVIFNLPKILIYTNVLLHVTLIRFWFATIYG